MEVIIIAIALGIFFLAGFFLGRNRYDECQDDLNNIRDILFEEEGNNYADRD